MAAHNELGKWGEELAAKYLEDQGYEILERDWKSGHHDLDIIARNEEALAIIEVKTRRNRLFGAPEEAIDYKKRLSLQSAINHYIKSHRIKVPCPFRCNQYRWGHRQYAGNRSHQGCGFIIKMEYE